MSCRGCVRSHAIPPEYPHQKRYGQHHRSGQGQTAVILSLINEEIKSSYFSLERIQEIFTSVSLARIKQLILQVMHKYEYFLDDYSLLNYVLHIALTVELRSSNPARKFNASRQELVSHADMLNLASAHVQSIVNDLYVLLKENYDTDFTLYDLYEASVLMMTRRCVLANVRHRLRSDQRHPRS